MGTPSARRQRGFTLLELLTTMTVATVLSAVAVPNLSTLTQNARRTALLNQLVGSVHLARIEAATRGRSVVVCGSANGATCGGASAWNRGWIVFVNLDDKPAERDPATEPLLQVFETGKGQSIRVSLAGGGTAIQLRPFDTRSSNGTLTVCDHRGEAAARAVVIGVLGRPYVSARDGSRRVLSCT